VARAAAERVCTWRQRALECGATDAEADAGRRAGSALRAALALFTLACLQIPWLPAGQAQLGTVDRENVVDWYYAPIFGTGIYASGSRSVAVIQLQFPHVIRETTDEQWGLKFTLPVSIGFYDYDLNKAVDRSLPSGVSTLSVVPQIEWEIPLTRRWTLKPYAGAGLGTELSGDEKATIYDFGVRSRFLLSATRGTEVALLNRLTSAGYRVSGGTTNTLGFLATAIDFQFPSGLTLAGQALRLSVTPTHYYYFGRLDFPQFNNRENRLREEFELAFSLSTRKPLPIPYLSIDRLGIAVRAGGGVTGVRIFTSLPF
jgi:hypothetical protein